jgi:threonine dehydrogenase-like Zn-dependent dehydrogenase
MFANNFIRVDKKPEITVTTALPLTPPPEKESGSPTWAIEDLMETEEQRELGPVEPESIVAVIGVGYVGRHLVEGFAKHYNVIAFDLSERRLAEVSKQLTGLPIQFTSNAKDISQASHVLISVPTILKDDKTIDTTYLRSAITTVEKYVKAGSTVVIESSVAVGMTRDLVGPLMTSKQLKVGMSPEVSFSITKLPIALHSNTPSSELTPAAHFQLSKIFPRSSPAWTHHHSSRYLHSTDAFSTTYFRSLLLR